MEMWRRVMDSVNDLQRFIFKETGIPPRRNPSLGPLPREEADKPHPSNDPLAAYKISRRATRQSEREGKAQQGETSNTEELQRKFPKSDEIPM